MAPTETPIAKSRSIGRALTWARGRFWRHRSRRLSLAGLVVVLAVVGWFAMTADWSTSRLAVLGAGLALAVGIAAALFARVWPIRPEVAARVADRGLDLGDRLITGMDPEVVGPFRRVVDGELEARLERRTEERVTRVGRPTRMPRWIRRWRFHLLIVLLLLLLFGLHGVFGPGLRPRADAVGGDDSIAASVGGVEASLEIALDRGTEPIVTMGAPIPARVRLRGGAGDALGVQIQVDDAAPEPVAGRVAPNGSLPVDLGPVIERSGRATPGEHRVRALVVGDDGRTMRSNTLRIVITDTSGGGGSRGGESDPSEDPKPVPQPKDEPAAETPGDTPPALGDPERVDLVRRPFFVAPIIDERGEIVEGERWTLDYLTGGKHGDADPDATRPPAVVDLLAEYERQAERAMARDAIPERLRAIYRRYVRELTRR